MSAHKKRGPRGKGPRDQITIRVPIGIKDRLVVIAEARDESVIDVVSALIVAHINELEEGSDVSAQEQLDIDFRATG